MKLLVLDAYAPDGRDALRSAGGTEAGKLYADLLRRLVHRIFDNRRGLRDEREDLAIDIAYPADPDPARSAGDR